MRMFWGIIVLLVLGTAGLLAARWSGGGGSRPGDGQPPLPVRTQPSETAARPVAEDLGSASPLPVEAGAPTPDDAVHRDQVATAGTPDPAGPSLDELLGVGPEEPGVMGQEAGADGVDAQPAVSLAATEGVPEALEATGLPVAADAAAGNGAAEAAVPSEIETEPAALALPEAPADTIPAPAVAAAAPEAPRGPVFGGYEVIPSVKAVKDDGSTVLDERFTVSGKGTEAEPYRVTWEHLISASETLAPRQGKKKLPERITMLDGQWVEVSGYIAFPLMVEEADELLLMLNQWDGCCIGIPPTPYDAIEVMLNKPAKGQDRFAIQGSVKGRLGVKPHLVGEWLVGIYVMDNASLSTKAIGGVSQ